MMIEMMKCPQKKLSSCAESIKNKKVKKLPASSPHVDGKYHPPLLDVAVL